MRYASPKFLHDGESRRNAFGFAIVIAAGISAITTALYTLAIAAQGGFPLNP